MLMVGADLVWITLEMPALHLFLLSLGSLASCPLPIVQTWQVLIPRRMTRLLMGLFELVWIALAIPALLLLPLILGCSATCLMPVVLAWLLHRGEVMINWFLLLMAPRSMSRPAMLKAGPISAVAIQRLGLDDGICARTHLALQSTSLMSLLRRLMGLHAVCAVAQMI
jgi:hypothetical protein